MPNPSRRPSTDAITPITSASATTIRVTCPPLAPMARISASWRARWATVIENVLKMMNAATNTEMYPNTRRKVVRMLSWSFTSWDCCCWTFWPVLTSRLPGTTPAMRSRSSVSDTPESAATLIESRRPAFSKARCASGRVNSAVVEPPRLWPSGNSASPTSR